MSAKKKHKTNYYRLKQTEKVNLFYANVSSTFSSLRRIGRMWEKLTRILMWRDA